jgi:Bacterial domain of unknown function (DUF1798).
VCRKEIRAELEKKGSIKFGKTKKICYDESEVRTLDEEQVRKITEQLLQVIQKSAQRFERTKKEGLEYDFFAEIKPSVDKILPILDEWEIVAKKWINKYHPRYLHSQQIDTAKEHIENIVIQSFFQDTSKVRFKNIKESAEYTLRSMIREMEKNK